MTEHPARATLGDAPLEPPAPESRERPLDVRVVAHTHWDREWYHPAGRFRQRLVALVDELLDDSDATAAPFLLDGQGVVLDDYLAVRPERRAALASALARGALEAGPWYVLADELIPSGESLVRNLLAGRRALADLGAAPPPVLYCPDSFGHPAALPSIAAGFGLPVLIAWRGYGGRRWPAGDSAWWTAPDGSRVVLFHLPPDGYELGSNLPADDEGARARWARVRAELAPRSALGLVLLQNGADHHARQRGQREALAALARAAEPDRVAPSSLADFARDLAARAAGAALPSISGELRDSYGYTWALQGTFASRAAQKRRNAGLERALLRESEPWALLALAIGRRSSAPALPYPALLRAAWRTLLLCHPHDTLCGCSTDEVARAMDARLDDAHSQALGVRDDALLDVIGHDAVDARTRHADRTRVLVVRNAAARSRAGVAEVELSTFLRDVPVGPGSAARGAGEERGRGAPVTVAGGAVPLQILERVVRHERTESPRHYPDDDLVEVARAVAWVPEIGGYGTASFELAERVAPSPALPPDVAPALARDSVLENGLLRVEIGRDGRVRLDSALSGAAVPSLLRFEDVGDAGDLYTHSPVGRVTQGGWFLGTRVVHSGPLRAELEARWRVRLPVSRAPSGGSDDAPQPSPVRGGRSARHEEGTLVVRFTLDAAAPFLRVHVHGTNRWRDHRLRIVFATDVAGGAVRADAAFGPVARAPIEVPPEDRLAETPPPTAPLHRYVTLHDETRGVTLFGDGLAEYEATEGGEIAVTLVRAVGELSRADLPERPGHAGWPVPTPEAQSPGPFEASFAVMPHGPLDDDTADAIERAADDVLLPLAGATLRSALELPPRTSGIELAGPGLAFSTAKPSEDGEWAVLRCVNVTDRPVAGAWTLGFRVADARLGRLDETAGESLPVTGSNVAFTAAPRAIVTVLARPGR